MTWILNLQLALVMTRTHAKNQDDSKVRVEADRWTDTTEFITFFLTRSVKL